MVGPPKDRSLLPSEGEKEKDRFGAAEEKKRSEGRRKNLNQPNAVMDNADI